MRPRGGPGWVGRPSQWFGGGLETLEEVIATFAEVWEGFRGTPRGPGGVGRPSRRSKTCLEAITDVLER